MKPSAAYLVSGLTSLLLAVSCTSSRDRANRLDEAHRSAGERVAIRPVLLPELPSLLREEYAHPPRTIRQSFSWGPRGNEWSLRILDSSAQHAGFVLRRPHDLSDRREHMSLYMEIEPTNAASALSVGLVDGMKREPRVLSIMALEPHHTPVRFREPRQAIAVPLTAFEKDLVNLENGSEFAGRLDWSDLREIRIILPEPAPESHRTITIHNIQFAPDTWIRTR